MSGNVERDLENMFASDSDDQRESADDYMSHDGSPPNSSSSSTEESEAEGATDVNEEWSTENRQPNLPFSEAPCFNVHTAECPIDYFYLLFSTNFLNILVASINAHAIQVLLESNHEHSRISRWVNTNIEEIKIFLALLFHMGHIKLNRINDYWRRGKLFDLPFGKFMSRDRFLLILRTLYYKDDHHYDDFVTRPTQSILDYFNNKMHELVTPTRNLTIDETLVLWRGRLRIRQYIKGKRHKYGIKLYVLTDSTGLCLKIHLYKGSRDPLVGGNGHAKKVVLALMQNYLNKGYCLHMDNFYNSIDLAETLLNLKTYVTGTLRLRRSRNPSFVAMKLPRGSSVFKYNRKGVCVSNFNDKRKVLTLSTQYSGELVETTSRRRGIVVKPKMIVEYNNYMKGVDRKDQLLSYYSCYNKSMRWYKKILVHIFQVMLLNAHLMYNNCHSSNKMSFYKFRIQVLESLLNISNNVERNIQTDRSSRPNLRTTDLGEIIHLPKSCPKDDRGRTKRRRCNLCYSKNRLRKLVMFYCPLCPQQPGLCLECFAEFHKYKQP